MSLRVLAAALLLPLAAGCVATKQDIRDLQLQISANQVAQDTLVRRLIRRTETMLDSLSDQNVRMRGDLATRLVNIERQLVQIQELSGQNTAQLAELRRQVDQAAEDARRTQQAAAATDVGEGEPEGGGDPQELYDASLAALRRGSVSTARAGFEELVSSHPEHRLAADAQYQIGQSFEQGRDAPAAITAYGRVVELYPTSPRAPAALLRIGRLELARSNRNAARERFNQIVRSYPRSPEAGEARNELQRLGS